MRIPHPGRIQTLLFHPNLQAYQTLFCKNLPGYKLWVKYHAHHTLYPVQVYRWSDGSYLEDQDFIRMSGIFRDVFLFAKDKKASLFDFAYTTTFDYPEGTRPADSNGFSIFILQINCQFVEIRLFCRPEFGVFNFFRKINYRFLLI